MDTISGKESLSILPLGYAFKCLLSLTAFFPHLSQKALLKSVPMVKCGNNEEKENTVDNPLLSESP